MKKILEISVIIPTINRFNSLTRTINTMLDNEFIPSEIIIIDQSEDLEIRNAIREYTLSIKTTELVYIYQEFASSTKARNTGIKYAKNEILCFCDDDIDVEENTLKNVYDLMQNNEILMIGGLDNNSLSSKRKIGYFIGTKSFFKRKKGHVTLSILGRYPNNVVKEVETEWAMGYFIVVRKSILLKYKLLFDEILIKYAYAEDLDFTYSYYKISQFENKKCILTPNVKVTHLVSQEYRIPNKLHIYMYLVNRQYLSYKHFENSIYRIPLLWCNFWQFIRLIIMKGDYQYFLRVWLFVMKNKQDIKEGILHYEEVDRL